MEFRRLREWSVSRGSVVLVPTSPDMGQVKFPEIDGRRGIKEVTEQFFGFQEHGVGNGQCTEFADD